MYPVSRLLLPLTLLFCPFRPSATLNPSLVAYKMCLQSYYSKRRSTKPSPSLKPWRVLLWWGCAWFIGGVIGGTTTYTASSGMLYDSGGPTNQYKAGENTIQIVKCPVVTQVVYFRFKQFQLDIFNIAYFQYCWDALKVYDGATASSPLLFNSCFDPGTDTYYLSSTSQMYLRFTADLYSNLAPGYSVEYTCIDYSKTEPLLDSGGMAGNYTNNENRLTMFKCPERNTMAATITLLDVDGSPPDCTKDTLSILQMSAFTLGSQTYGAKVAGVDTTGYKKSNLLTTCGTLSAPLTVDVDGNVVLLAFQSDASGVRAGYVLDIDCLPPAGIITDSGGPTNNYSNNENRQQVVKCASSTVVEFGFNQLDLQQSPTCNLDYIVIYDGPTNSSPELFRGCKETFLGILYVASSSTILVTFVSDADTVSAGYSLVYTCAAMKIYTGNHGAIYDSGGSTKNYGNNERLYQKVVCASPQRPILNFVSLELQTSSGCSKDYITVFDGPTTNSKVLFRGCASQITTSYFVASTNTALMNFISDSTVTAAGYYVNYHCAQIYNAPASTLTDTGGDAVFKADGTLQSNGYYDNDQDSLQLIQCRQNETISVQFGLLDMDNSVDIAFNNGCMSDKVQLKSLFHLPGVSYFSPLAVYTGCGHVEKSDLYQGAITSSLLLIHFVSDSIIGGPVYNPPVGYVMNYECVGVPTHKGTYGRIYDSGGPSGAYSNGETTAAVVQCLPGSVVVFQVKSLILQISAGCIKDSLTVYDGAYDGSSPPGPVLFTGCVAPDPTGFYFASGNEAYIKFVSDRVTTDSGYEISYSCAPTYTLQQGYVYDSGGRDGDYKKNEDSMSIILCNSTEKVTLMIENMEIRQQTFNSEVGFNAAQCPNDRLELFSSASSLSLLSGSGTNLQFFPIVGPQCGSNSLSPRMSSVGNVVIVHFVSNDDFEARGFELHYECRPAVSLHAGLIGSIFDTGGAAFSYGNNEFDEHLVQCPQLNMIIAFRFEVLELAGASESCPDYITIHDGTSSKSSKVFQGCTMPGVDSYYKTSSNQAYVLFTSDAQGVGKGFKLMFSCIEIIRGEHGAVYDSGGRDGNVLAYANGQQIIHCPEPTQAIQFTLSYLELNDPMNCLTDMEYFLRLQSTRWWWFGFEYGGMHPVLRIYDGEDAYGTLLLSTCLDLGIQSTVFISPSNSMYVNLLVTEEAISARGYELLYSCVNVKTATQGVVADSGGDSENYSNNENSDTLIVCPELHQVHIQFNYLDIDGPVPLCINDAVTIISYSKRVCLTKQDACYWFGFEPSVLHRACGSQDLLSNNNLWEGSTHLWSNTMMVNFRSNEDTVKSGYSLAYKCIPMHDTIQTTPFSNSTCGTEDTSKESTIVCGAASVVLVRFVFVKSTCETAVVILYDGSSITESMILYSGTASSGFANSENIDFITSSNKAHAVYSSSVAMTLKYWCSEIHQNQKGTIYDSGGDPSIGIDAIVDSDQSSSLIQALVSQDLFSDGYYRNDEETMKILTCPSNSFASAVLTEFKVATGDALSMYSASKIDKGYLASQLFKNSVPTRDPLSWQNVNNQMHVSDPAIWQSVSASNVMTILFTSGGNFVDKGYKLQYECLTTPTYTDWSGTVYDSGSKNGPYRNGENQRYLIECPTNKGVQLTFSFFDIEVSQDCVKDSIEIVDMADPYRPLFSKGCQDPGREALFLSTSNRVRVLFKSDGETVLGGFALDYTCMQVRNAPSATISYSISTFNGASLRNYMMNLHESMLVQCLQSQYVSLQLTELDLHFDASSDCGVNDFLQVDSLELQGSGSYRTRAETNLCGYQSKDTLWQRSLLSSAARITLVTDNDDKYGDWDENRKVGVELKYQCVSVPTFMLSYGTLYDSGGVDGKYGDDEIWMQKIQCRPDLTVTFYFSEFDMQYSEGCKSDRLDIFDGPSTASGTVYSSCQSPSPLSQVFIASSSEILIRLTSDSHKAGSGYTLMYKCASLKRGSVTETNDYRISKIAPEGSRAFENLRQYHLFICPEAAFVNVNSLEWKLDQDDHLSLFEGLSENGPLLYRNSIGSSGLWTAVSSGNSVYIQFEGDSNAYSGSYSISMSCSESEGLLPNSRKIVDSGGKEGNYRNLDSQKLRLECTDETMRILLKFTEFNIEDSPECSSDRLTITDGNSTAAPVLYSDCGYRAGDSLWSGISSTNKVFFSFQADETNVKGGYELQWECSAFTSLQNICNVTALEVKCDFGSFGSLEGALVKAVLEFKLDLLIHLEPDLDYESTVCGADFSRMERIVIEGHGSTIDCGDNAFIHSYSKFVNKNAYITVRHVVFISTNSPFIVLIITNAHSVILEDAVIKGNFISILLLMNVHSVSLSNCTFKDITSAPNYHQEEAALSTLVNLITTNTPDYLHVTITDCAFDNVTYRHGLVSISEVSSSKSISSVMVEMNRVTFTRNSGSISPLVVKDWEEGAVVITNCTFSSNKVTSGGGGGIHLSGSPSSSIAVHLEDSHFRSNQCFNCNGGGIYIENVKSINITECDVAANEASNGGGVFIDSILSNVTLAATTVISNKARNDGGGVVIKNVASGALEVCQSVLEKNINSLYSNAMGGGLYTLLVSKVVITDSNFTFNENGVGGGVFIHDTETFLGSNIICSDNKALLDGGCIALLSSRETNFVMFHSTLFNNEARFGGGGLSLIGKLVTVTVTSSTIDSNSASRNGGFALVAKGAVLSLDHSVVLQSKVPLGGAFYIDGSSKLLIRDDCHISASTAVNGSVAYLASAASYMEVRGSDITVTGNLARMGGVIYSSGIVRVEGVSKGVTIADNIAGPVSYYGDSVSSYVGMGSFLYFSGRTPPEAQSEVVERRQIHHCQVAQLSDSVDLHNNSAVVAGAIVFFEHLPLVGCSNKMDFLKRIESDFDNRLLSAGNHAGYGGVASSFADTIVLQYSDSANTICDGSIVANVCEQPLNLVPGKSTSVTVTPLDYFGQPIRGNYENLRLSIRIENGPSGGGGHIVPLPEDWTSPETDLLPSGVVMSHGNHIAPLNFGAEADSTDTSTLSVEVSGDFGQKSLAVNVQLLPCPSELLLQRHASKDGVDICRSPPHDVGFGALGKVVAVLLLLVDLLIVYIIADIIRHRELKVFKYLTVPAWCLRLLGLLIVTVAIILKVMEDIEEEASRDGPHSCHEFFLILQIGLYFILSPYLFTSWRLMKIFGNKTMDTVVVSDSKVMTFTGVAIFFNAALAGVLFASSGFKTKVYHSDVPLFTRGLCVAHNDAVYAFVIIPCTTLAIMMTTVAGLAHYLRLLGVSSGFFNYDTARLNIRLIVAMAALATLYAAIIYIFAPTYNYGTKTFIAANLVVDKVLQEIGLVAVTFLLMICAASEARLLFELKASVVSQQFISSKNQVRKTFFSKVAPEDSKAPSITRVVSGTKGKKGTAPAEDSSTNPAHATKGSEDGGGSAVKTFVDNFVRNIEAKSAFEGLNAKGIAKETDLWFAALLIEYAKQFNMSSVKAKVATTKILGEMAELYKMEQLIDTVAMKGIEYTVKLDMLFEGKGPSALTDFWLSSKEKLSRGPALRDGKPVTSSGFQGRDKRRKDTGGDLLFANEKLNAKLRDLLNKGEAGKTSPKNSGGGSL